MTGYCRAGDMYVDWPCPARACPGYDNCLRQYKTLSGEDKMNIYDYIGDRLVRRKLDPVETMRLYKMGLTDMQLACRFGLSEKTVYSWRKEMGLPPNGKVNTDKCRDCQHWKNGNGSLTGWSICFCHHLLETGKRRVVGEDGECQSYRKRVEE